jgi:hypothetical protein
MTIKPGGYDDPAQGWTGGYATQSLRDRQRSTSPASSWSLEGEFAKRKLWSNIGLHSAKGPTWGNMGRSFVRAALNSARNVRPAGQLAAGGRRPPHPGLHELDGLEFVARIDVEKDGRASDRNVVKLAVEPDHPTTRPHDGVAPQGYPGNRTARTTGAQVPATAHPHAHRQPPAARTRPRVRQAGLGAA